MDFFYRDTGAVDQAAKIPVDHVPRIHVISDLDIKDPSAEKPKLFKQPVVIRESSVVGMSLHLVF